MRINQFNDLSVTNVIEAKTRGTEDEFNTHLKRERHADPPEFSSQEVEEYINYSETLDMISQRPDERRDRRSEDQSYGDHLSGSRAAQSLTKSLVQQVACMAAGAVIVTNSYQAMVEARNLERNSLPAPPAAVVERAEHAAPEAEATRGEDIRNTAPVENSAEIEGGESSGGAEGVGNRNGTDNVQGENASESSDQTEHGDQTDVDADSASVDSIGGEDYGQTSVDADDATDDGSNQDKSGSESTNQSDGSADNKTDDKADGENGADTANDEDDSGGTILQPAGHTFGAPVREILGDGRVKLTFPCTDCGEDYVVILSVEPEQ